MTSFRPGIRLIYGVLRLALCTSLSLAQTDKTEQHRHVLTFDFLSLTYRLPTIEYEHILMGPTALTLRTTYWDETKDGWEWLSYGVGMGYRQYLLSDAATGLYWDVGGDIQYVWAWYTDDFTAGPLLRFTTGLGYATNYGRLAVKIGPAVRFYLGDLSIRGIPIPIVPLGLLLTLSMGIGW